MNQSQTQFRCDKCTVLRRKSMQTVPAVKQQKGNNPKQKEKVTTTPTPPTMKGDSTDATPNVISMQMLYEEILNLKSINTKFLDTVQQLQNENMDLKKKLSRLESKINVLEQQCNIKKLEIVGVPNANNSNAMDLVKKIFTEALGVQITNNSIEKCFVRNQLVKKTTNEMSGANGTNNRSEAEGTNSNNKSNNNKGIQKNIICVQLSSQAVLPFG